MAPGLDGTTVTVAVVDDFEIVLAGVARMLEPHGHLVTVVQLDANRPIDRPVDVVLYDTFAQAESHADDIQAVIDNPHAGRVVMYTWNFDQKLIDIALHRGACGYLSKGMPAADLAAAIVDIHSGHTVIAPVSRSARADERDWPGRLTGLTEREAEVLALVTSGRSNADIADLMFISPNSLKTHIRHLYAKIEVRTRAHAILYGVRHGFAFDYRRLESWRIDAAVERADERQGATPHQRSPMTPEGVALPPML